MTPKIDCPWHGVQAGSEIEFGVYQCPECQKRKEIIARSKVGDEVALDAAPEKAVVSKRQHIGSAKLSLRPLDRAVMYWEACEDVLAGDTLVYVPTRDGDFSLRYSCRPFRDPNKDLRRLFGVALEDCPKGQQVPLQVLSFLPNEEEHDDWVELSNCELVTEVDDD